MKRALCIAINDYPYSGLDLSGCVNDARDWAAVLKARGFVTELLLDRNATGKMMRDRIAAHVEPAKRGDTVVVTFSGHGTFVPDQDGDEPDGTDEALCPWDVMHHGPLIDDELGELLGRARSGVKVVMLSDSCHSGTVTRFNPITPPATIKGPKSEAPQRKVRFLPPATFLSARQVRRLGNSDAVRTATKPGRNSGVLISGCEPYEYCYDAFFQGRPNGAFTYVALRALKTLPANATYASWIRAIRQTLPSQQYPQRPNLYATAGQKRWRVLT